MRLYKFDAHADRAIADFGSVGLTITPIVRTSGEVRAVSLGWESHTDFASGGVLGNSREARGFRAGLLELPTAYTKLV